MLSENTIQAIENTMQNSADRVFVFSSTEGDFVVKRQRPRRKGYASMLLTFTAKLFNIPSLVPVRNLGGKVAQEQELTKLRELKNLGINVPAIALIRCDYFIMHKVGNKNLAETIEKASPEDAVRLWLAGLETLLNISLQNTNLSQAHARNFVIGKDEKLYAIDFEDNPKACLGLLQAQARDWLFYLSSTLWMLPLSNPEKAAHVKRFLDKLPPELSQAIAKASQFGSLLRFLPSKRKWVGRDIMTIQTTAEVMHIAFKRA